MELREGGPGSLAVEPPSKCLHGHTQVLHRSLHRPAVEALTCSLSPVHQPPWTGLHPAGCWVWPERTAACLVAGPRQSSKHQCTEPWLHRLHRPTECRALQGRWGSPEEPCRLTWRWVLLVRGLSLQLLRQRSGSWTGSPWGRTRLSSCSTPPQAPAWRPRPGCRGS